MRKQNIVYNSPANRSFYKIIVWPFKSYLRILAVVVFIGAFQYQSIRIDMLAREIRELELKRNQLINSNATLEVHIDQLTHINRIEKLAREKFDLIPSGNQIEKLVIEPFSPDRKLPQEETGKKLKLAGVN